MQYTNMIQVCIRVTWVYVPVSSMVQRDRERERERERQGEKQTQRKRERDKERKMYDMSSF